MRSPKLLLLTGTLVAALLAAFALFTLMHWDPPQIRLNQLLQNQNGHLTSVGAGDSSGTAVSTGETWMAEFCIQAPPGSTIWLKDESIVVEIPGASGDWTTIRKEAPVTRAPVTSIVNPFTGRTGSRAPSPTGTRTIIRTMWLTLPAGAKTCRFTIIYRPESVQERGTRLLSSPLARRFPKVSGWIVKHLPTTERWRTYHREVAVKAVKIEQKETEETERRKEKAERRM